MPATWCLGQRDSWGFINYLGSLLSAALEFRQDLSCTGWPINVQRKAAGSWCVNEHIQGLWTRVLQALSQLEVEEKTCLCCVLLKVLFIIPSCFFKGTWVAEYYLEHFVSSQWLDRKRSYEFTFYPQEDCLGESLQCSGQKQDPVQNAWCLNSGSVTSSLCDVTCLHLFPHL